MKNTFWGHTLGYGAFIEAAPCTPWTTTGTSLLRGGVIECGSDRIATVERGFEKKICRHIWTPPSKVTFTSDHLAKKENERFNFNSQTIEMNFLKLILKCLLHLILFLSDLL